MHDASSAQDVLQVPDGKSVVRRVYPSEKDKSKRMCYLKEVLAWGYGGYVGCSWHHYIQESTRSDPQHTGHCYHIQTQLQGPAGTILLEKNAHEEITQYMLQQVLRRWQPDPFQPGSQKQVGMVPGAPYSHFPWFEQFGWGH
jgi:hypothetical protein